MKIQIYQAGTSAMTNNYAVKQRITKDAVIKAAKYVFAISIAMLLLCVAVFGGVALGNSDITDTVLETDAADTLEVAEAGSATNGNCNIAFSLSSLGANSISTSFGDSNTYFYRWWENSFGHSTYCGAGKIGNGGSGWVKGDTLSSASINFNFSGVAYNLQQQGLLTITISVRMDAENGYDGTRKAGFMLGSSNMTAANSSLLSGFTIMTSSYFDEDSDYSTGSASANLSSAHTTVCLAVGGYCEYDNKWYTVGGRCPGQSIKSIVVTCTSRDTATPYFSYPSYSSWTANSRDVSYTVKDEVQMNSVTLYRNGTAIAPSSISTTTTSWTVVFNASYQYSYYITATDTTGNSATSSTYNYNNYKLDAYNPTILQVLYVRSSDITKLVTNGLSPGTGTPWSGDVTCYIQVADYDGNTDADYYSSGIASVTYGGIACTLITTDTTIYSSSASPWTQTTSKRSTVDGLGYGCVWYKYSTNLSANADNVAIVVTDKVGKTATTTASLSHIDKIAPIVESAVVVNNGTTITTTNASTWFNTTAILTLTIVDYATTGTLSATRDRAAGLDSILLTGTEYSRNTAMTAGSTTKAISASFNPTTATETSGINGTTAYYMARTSYVAGTSGSYYCYRYVITVPILYHSNYSFTITDKAGNALTQFAYNHTSGTVSTYNPLIDQTAPVYGSTTVTGYTSSGTSLGSVTASYVNADYLKFDITATDLNATGRNDGSGISKIQIYNSAGTTLLSQWTGTAYQSSSTAKSLYVYKTGFSGTKDGTFIAYADINSCTNPNYKIVITDAAGNATTLVPSSGTGSMQINPNGSGAVLSIATYVDNIVPTLTVQNTSGTTLTAGSETYNSDTNTRIYEYSWTASSQAINIISTFGCSGATLYQYSNTLLDSGRTPLSSYTGTTYNKNNNSYTRACTFSSEGINYYSFKIINGASVAVAGHGTNTAYNIVLKVKVDKTAPTYELLGFGTGITIAGKDIAGMKSSIVSPLGTTALTETLLSTANSYYGNSFKAYYYIKDTFGTTADNRSGTSWLSGGLAKSTVTVKHGNYSYTYNLTYDNVSNTSYTILTVEMYNIETLKNMTYNSVSIYNNGTYNLIYGSNVIYNINIYDAVGNTNQIKGGSGTLIGKTDLSYNVDPFPINNSVVSTVKDTTYGYDYTGTNPSDVSTTPWTDLDIRYTLAKQTSITSVVCQYKLVTMDDSSGTPVMVGTVDDYEWIDVGDLGSATTASFILSINDSSKCAFVYFRIYKNYCNFGDTYSSYTSIVEETTKGYTPQYIIRQDKDDPIITAVYFSRSSNITNISNPAGNANILAYFTAVFDGNAYTFTRVTGNTNVWTFEKFYMYVIATDNRGTGSGSGVKTVTLYNQDDTQTTTVCLATVSSSTGEKIYRSASANFGYSTADNTNAMYFKLTDNKDNITSKTAVNTDTGSQRILPRVDTVMPTVSLTSAKYGESNNISYLSSGKLSGTSIKQNLNITLTFTTGISGAKLYRIELSDYYGDGYTAGDDPWGYAANFTGTSINSASTPYSLSGLVNASSFSSLTPILTVTAANASCVFTETISNSIEVKARYYYFIVSNINEYSGQRPFGYLVAGDVFIDNKAPVIEDTVFVSQLTNSVMNIATTYTNGKVYAYYKATDSGSGIDKVSLLGTSEDLTYITSGTYAGYYLLTMEDNKEYQIRAFDKAGNYVTSTAVNPLIDKTVPDLTIDTTLANDTEYASYSSGNFTNSDYINVVLTANVGISGLNRIMYSINGGITYYNITALLDKDSHNVTVVGNVATFRLAASNTYMFVVYNNIGASFAVYDISDEDNLLSTHTIEPKLMYIAIDNIAPALNESDSLYVSIKSVWHSNPQIITLDITDNTNGSGIDNVIMSYKLNGINQDDVIFIYDEATDRYVTTDSFTLSYFVTYKIIVTDNAGNSSEYSIRPALDTAKPTWSTVSGSATTYTLKNEVDETTRTAYTADTTWTQYDVEVALNPSYSMSGAKVQYSINNGSTWIDSDDLLLSWDPSIIANIPDSDYGTFINEAQTYSVITDQSTNTRYLFRIVSGSGVVSDTLDVGVIKIDKEQPELAATSGVAYGNKNTVVNGTFKAISTFTANDDAYIYNLTNWTSYGAIMYVNTASTLVSGVVIQLSYYNGTNWSEWAAYTNTDSNYQSADKKTNKYIYTEDTSCTNFKFRFVSGSGVISKEMIVDNIQIDKVAPALAVTGKNEYSDQTDADIVDNMYAEASSSVGTTDYGFNGFTYAKYIVLCIDIQTIGISGANLYFKKDDGEAIQYESITANGKLYYYIPESVLLGVTLTSGAGLSYTITKKIEIDNVMPELYVASISGTKSTNWDNTIANSWYTSDITFNFGVGTYSTDGNLSRSTAINESGFYIKYAVSEDNGLTYSTWIDIGKNVTYYKISGSIIAGHIYRFCIVSGSGLINELGKDLEYNGSVVATADAVMDSISYNHSTALISHLSDTDFNYSINYDKNNYTYTTNQFIEYYANGQLNTAQKTSYAQYIYYIKLNGTYVKIAQNGTAEQIAAYNKYKDGNFKHGDEIKVEYIANNNNTLLVDGFEGDSGEYYCRYTDYYYTYTNSNNEVVTVYLEDDDESITANGGSFAVQFTTHNLVIDSYFKKELSASFGNLNVYLQSASGTFNSTATVSYTPPSSNSVDLDVQLSYKNIATGENLILNANGTININDLDIGGYLITVSFEDSENSDSFVLTNPCSVLLVKYFTENGVSPFTINNQKDLEMVSSTYNVYSVSGTSYELTDTVSYLESSFTQVNNIALSEFVQIGDAGNAFSGTYDGNGKAITCASMVAASGTFGLFAKLTGTVSNLALSVTNTIIVTNGSNVGVLAGIIDGGTVNNVSVKAEMCINSTVSDANIGGLAGSVTNAQIGRLSANYVDVRMTHDSTINTNVIGANSNIGGVAGFVGAGTYLNNTYSFGGMEIYYVDTSVNVGIVIGSLADYVTEVNKSNYFTNNNYFNGNAFVNDMTITDFIGNYEGAVSITNSNALAYRDFVTSDVSSSVGGVTIVGTTIRDSVLTKLYNDFAKATANYTFGLGTSDSVFVISTLEDIENIDKYVFLNYKLMNDVDMSDFGTSIAIHKVFTGILNGKNTTDSILTNFAGNASSISENYFGLFANFNGTITNLVLNDLDINVTKEDSNDLYVGLIAAKSYENAIINNIIAIGSVVINAADSDVIAGALVGQATRGYIYNIFNMANIKVTARNLSLGGIAGDVTNTVLVNFTDAQDNEISDAVFSLARVEGNFTGFGSVGAIVGDGVLLEALSDMTKVFALEDNTYSNGNLTNYLVGSSTTNSTTLTSFANTTMRGTSVSDGNLFTEVFVTRSLYPLSGISETASSTVGSVADNPFKISSEEDFKYINNALYAYYRVAEDITFTNFETIGDGLFFTGKIDGKTASSGSAEEGTVVALHNVTDSLFYYNKGIISDLSMEVVYTKVLGNNEDEVFGAIAKYNKGTIRSVIVSGNITVSGGSSIAASGFVGVDNGGTIDNSSIKNSISSLVLDVKNTGTAYVGGYVGVIMGATTISFAIGQGSITIEDCNSYYVGWLVGRVEGTLTIDLTKIQDYTYSMTIKENGVVTEVIPTLDSDTGEAINYYGWNKIDHPSNRPY